MSREILRKVGKETARRLGILRPAFRLYEFTQTLRPGVLAPGRSTGIAAPDGLPIPPARLMTLVAGNADVRSFLEGGRLAYQSIAHTLSRRGLRPESFHSVLDFGCGCGRVLRNWSRHGAQRLYGTDYNPELIGWCARNLPFARFSVNALQPPLVFAERQFDFAYALSVFTHLPPALQADWMRELWRVLTPGGYLLLTTHGRRYLSRLTVAERARFDAGQMVMRDAEVAGTNLCCAFHPVGYVRTVLGKDWELVDVIEEGATGNAFQDVFLMRKPRGGE